MLKQMKKKGVLIVDDATYVRNRLKKIVDNIDFAEVVGEASNGEDAVSLYKDLKPDLVTMDLVMPNYDGLQAIDSIMKFDKSAKIIVVSAMGQELSVAEAMEKGAREYIKKPFKDDEVSKIFEQILNN
jgi:two-component system chemotaxis response regulator CheY